MRNGWRTCTFGELGRVFNGNSISESEKKARFVGLASGVPYIGTKDIGFDHEITYDSGVKIPVREMGGFKVAPADTVLVCAEGGSAGRKVAHTDREVCFGNKLFAIRPILPTSGRFIFYYCLSDAFANQFKGAMAGLIGGVSLSKFRDLTITLPTLPEQQRIVAILDEASEEIAAAKANAEQNHRNAHEVFQSHLHRVLTERGPGWMEESLEGLVDSGAVKLFRGKVISKSTMAATPGDFPVYSSARENNGQFGSYGLFMFDEELITWSVDGGGRLFHRPRHKFSVTNVGGVLRILRQDQLAYGYLHRVLSYLHSQVRFDWVRKAHPSVILKLYDHVPVPPLDVQQRLAESLDEIEAATQHLSSVYQRKLAALEALQRALLHQAFTGAL